MQTTKPPGFGRQQPCPDHATGAVQLLLEGVTSFD
jgi:hypothetical protein